MIRREANGRFPKKSDRRRPSGAFYPSRDIIDAVGRIIPDRFALPFEYRAEILDWRICLEGLRDRLMHLLEGPYAVDVDTTVIERAFKVLLDELYGNAPAYWCRCRIRPCTRCKGRQWITHYQADLTGPRDPLPLSLER